MEETIAISMQNIVTRLTELNMSSVLDDQSSSLMPSTNENNYKLFEYFIGTISVDLEDLSEEDKAKIELNTAIRDSIDFVHMVLGQCTRDDEIEKMTINESIILSELSDINTKIRDAVDTFLSTGLERRDPAWIMPVNHSGEIVIGGANSDYKFVHPGKTAQKIIVQSSQWQCQELATDIGFIIGVVRCDTRDIQNRKVSPETLKGASADDLEVFDSIHEIDRIYDKTDFGLGIIKMGKELEVETSNNLAELILEHLKNKKSENQDLSSLSLFVVAESYNICRDDKNSVDAIFNCIPFHQLKESGIESIEINLISCNTYEVAAELMIAVEKVALDNALAIKICFQDGYIFNNISYRYLPHTEYIALLDQMNSPEQQLLTQEYHLQEAPSTKNTRLIQVISPGFSNISARTIGDLSEFVQTKKVPTNGPGSEVDKKLIRPGKEQEIKSGVSYQYSVDYREREVDKSPQTTPLSSPRSGVTQKIDSAGMFK